MIWIRNYLYDHNILKSFSFNFPLICVGNLAVGGTGKTPMTELIVEVLKGRYQVATLSRGYKRKTKGFAIAGQNTTAIDIGDEPMQFHQKYPDITVAVGEERLVAIPQLLHSRPDAQVIILDDAFQHRSVRAGLNILLTEYKNLYTRDLMLPAGDLRDIPASRMRAHMFVVTKCPASLSVEEKEKIIKEIGPKDWQHVYFTTIEYAQPYHLFDHTPMDIDPQHECLLISGIANPRPLMEYLETHAKAYEMLKYPDHHIFTSLDLKEIIQHYNKMDAQNSFLLTTEKDGVRLQKFAKELAHFPLYVIPIRHKFLFQEAELFNSELIRFVESYPARQQFQEN